MQGSRDIKLPAGKRTASVSGASTYMEIGMILGLDAALEYAADTRCLRLPRGMGSGADDGDDASREAACLFALCPLARMGHGVTRNPCICLCLLFQEAQQPVATRVDQRGGFLEF